MVPVVLRTQQTGRNLLSPSSPRGTLLASGTGYSVRSMVSDWPRSVTSEVIVKVSQQVYSSTGLVDDPRDLIQYKIEHLLFKQRLILANKVFIRATGPLRPCGSSES